MRAHSPLTYLSCWEATRSAPIRWQSYLCHTETLRAVGRMSDQHDGTLCVPDQERAAMHCARDPSLGEMYALVRSEALLAQRLDRLTHQVCGSGRAHGLCGSGGRPGLQPECLAV